MVLDALQPQSRVFIVIWFLRPYNLLIFNELQIICKNLLIFFYIPIVYIEIMPIFAVEFIEIRFVRTGFLCPFDSVVIYFHFLSTLNLYAL